MDRRCHPMDILQGEGGPVLGVLYAEGTPVHSDPPLEMMEDQCGVIREFRPVDQEFRCFLQNGVPLQEITLQICLEAFLIGGRLGDIQCKMLTRPYGQRADLILPDQNGIRTSGRHVQHQWQVMHGQVHHGCCSGAIGLRQLLGSIGFSIAASIQKQG